MIFNQSHIKESNLFFSFILFCIALIWLDGNRLQKVCANPVVDIQIAETIVHENFVPTSKSHENDIALIRLQRPAPYNDFIRPICLPNVERLHNKSYDGAQLVVAGFGRNQSG